MGASLAKHGQLVPVKVRASSKHEGKYELVFGHRRFLAAKSLGWKSIKAIIAQADESQMVFQSLIENLERDELSDYEKALTFRRLNKDFHLTYQQIGELFGFSKAHIGNYVSMLGLFDPDYLAANPELVEWLHKVTEHHARILSRVKDTETRKDLLGRIAKENISVRELTNIVDRLRSWFRPVSDFLPRNEDLVPVSPNSYDHDQREQISSLIVNKLRLIHSGDFGSVENMRIFDDEFSLFSAFPPYDKVEKGYAISKVRNWSYESAPKLSCKVTDFEVELFGEVALATMTLNYSGTYHGRQLKMRSGGSVLLLKRNGEWKIRHEHWSRLSGNHTDLLEETEATGRSLTKAPS
jgi:ParB family transcriptional regulator, chromosome partitioning protein